MEADGGAACFRCGSAFGQGIPTRADWELSLYVGKVKAIGVSNWSIPYLEDLSKTWKVVPAINQVELHPYNPQHDLKKYCDDKGIILEAYCPLGSTGAPLLKDEQLIQVAEKYGVSPATVCISYQVNRGVVVLPKSVTAERKSHSHVGGKTG